MNTSPDYYAELSADYQRVEQAIYYMITHHTEQPDLKEIANHVYLSEYHFQRLFTNWVGISPKRFLQYLTKETAKQMLEQSASLLEASYASGLSSPSRLHDLFVSCEAVTPGEYKRRGEGLSLRYGFHPTPFGECLLAVSERGICNLSFVEAGDREAARADLQNRWLKASLVEDAAATAPHVEGAFAPFTGGPIHSLNLHLQGTNFQIKVWEALLRIPPGKVVTYEEIAMSVGTPRGFRAVGSAVGRNPIAVLIPCHRVIRKMGELGGYRYGLARKHALLGWEWSRQ
jgi:AraC family transcriptional regulator of adaptative response/methylated-DNA-[protein]-cysteine methyltransferase